MDQSKNVIFHVDVNSAFLSWEAAYRVDVLGETVDLREVPSVVGGDEEKRHGIVLAKSTPMWQLPALEILEGSELAAKVG